MSASQDGKLIVWDAFTTNKVGASVSCLLIMCNSSLSKDVVSLAKTIS